MKFIAIVTFFFLGSDMLLANDRDHVINELSEILLDGQGSDLELKDILSPLSLSDQLWVIAFLRRSGLYDGPSFVLDGLIEGSSR